MNSGNFNGGDENSRDEITPDEKRDGDETTEEDLGKKEQNEEKAQDPHIRMTREEIYRAYGFTPYEPPTPPKELSGKQRIALVLISVLSMAACGLLGMFAPASDARISLLVSVFTLICYTVVGGFVAMVVIDRPRTALIMPALAFIITFGIATAAIGEASYSVLCSALLCLFPAVGGIALAWAMKSGAKRTGAILISAVSCGIFTLAIIALAEYLSTGCINISAIGEGIEQTRAQTVELLGKELAELGDSYEIDLAALDIEGMVNGVFNILPAIAVLAFSLIAFFAQLTLLALGRMLNLYHKFEKKDTEFTVSAVSAAVFALSYIGSVILSASDSAAMAVLDNLSLILMPPLALRGLLLILPRREGNAVRVGCFPLVFVLFLVAFAPGLAVLFLAVWGSFLIIKEAIVSLKKKD